jgi:hypothetical protein
MNDLATPNSTVNNDISMNIYVSAVDLQVAEPRSLFSFTNSYSATVQAGDMEMDGSNEAGCGPNVSTHVVGNDSTTPQDMEVYFGERIVSFRQMLKRYQRHSTFVIANSSTSVPAVWAPVFTDVPFYYGYNNVALHTPTVPGKFSYVSSTLLHYLMPAFACMRGSHRSKYVVTTSQPGDVGTLTVFRAPNTVTSVPAAVTLLAIVSQLAYAKLAYTARSDVLAGAAITGSQQQPFVEVEFPYYKPVRYDESKSVRQSGSAPESPFNSNHAVELTFSPSTRPVTLTRYISVGEDFC